MLFMENNLEWIDFLFLTFIPSLQGLMLREWTACSRIKLLNFIQPTAKLLYFFNTNSFGVINSGVIVLRKADFYCRFNFENPACCFTLSKGEYL